MGLVFKVKGERFERANEDVITVQISRIMEGYSYGVWHLLLQSCCDAVDQFS